MCTAGTDRQAFAFAGALLSQSISVAVTRIREFAEDDAGPIRSTIGYQAGQLGYVAIVQEVLYLHLFQVTSCDTIGVPRRHRVGMCARVFGTDS